METMANAAQTETAGVTVRVKGYWEAASCGTTWTAQEKYTRPYFEEIEQFRYEHEPYIHSFAQFTRWRDKDILEVGIGAGTDFLQFVRAGARAHGIDLTEEAVRNVERRLEIYGLRASETRVANAEHIPSPDNAFDLVYSWGVIHHADDMEQVFREICRVTRPGGVVKIMVYNYHSLHAWYLALRYGVWRGRGRRWAVYHHQESYATKVYSRSQIEKLVWDVARARPTFEFWNQRVRRGSRFERVRRLVDRFTPPSMRWYMAFQFRKPVA